MRGSFLNETCDMDKRTEERRSVTSVVCGVRRRKEKVIKNFHHTNTKVLLPEQSQRLSFMATITVFGL